MSNTIKRAPGARRVAIFGATVVAATAIIFAAAVGGLADRASAATIAGSSSEQNSELARTTAMQASIDAEEAQVAKEAKAAEAIQDAQTKVADARVKVDTAAAKAAAERQTLDVWTSGFQTQINACRGAVDVTAHYGTRTVAEHWQCGGSSFPTAAGTIVTLTGLDAGTYRVVGMVAVLNAYTARTTQIPRGYSLLFQTCRNGDSHTTEFIALQKLS